MNWIDVQRKNVVNNVEKSMVSKFLYSQASIIFVALQYNACTNIYVESLLNNAINKMTCNSTISYIYSHS